MKRLIILNFSVRVRVRVRDVCKKNSPLGELTLTDYSNCCLRKQTMGGRRLHFVAELCLLQIYGITSKARDALHINKNQEKLLLIFFLTFITKYDSL
jgi:hypothetical protein